MVGAMLALTCFVQLAGDAIAEPLSRAEGQVFDFYDSDRRIRNEVEPALAQELLLALKQSDYAEELPEQTARNAVAIQFAAVREIGQLGDLPSEKRKTLGAFVMMTALQATAEHHPEVTSSITSYYGNDSPIEDFCNCHKSGARACGCNIRSAGPGACSFTVRCPGYGKSICAAVSLELCVLQNIFDIIK